MVGYNITIQLINYVDALAVWGLRPHAPPLTMSVVLTGNKFQYIAGNGEIQIIEHRNSL